MKWWVVLLAFFVLSAFAVFGVFYFHSYVETKPHGIILFVVNGLDQNLLQRARQQALARGQSLQIDRLNKLAFLGVKGDNQSIPDEAAASTALTTGKLVANGYVGQTAYGDKLDNLTYNAQKSGRLTGLVTTSDLTMPTPLSFYGRGEGIPEEALRNAAELLDSSRLNVILGGGAQYFLPANVLNENGRRDGRNLFREAEKRGFLVPHNAQELDQLPVWRQRSVLGLFAPGQFVFAPLRNNVNAMPNLATMTRQAIRSLDYFEYNIQTIGGYFLVVEHGLVATAAKNNWTQLALDEVAEVDSAVGAALDYAGSKSLILVTNNISYGSLSTYRGIQEEAQNANQGGLDTVDWLTGPGGPIFQGSDDSYYRRNYLKQGVSLPNRAIYFTRQTEVTAEPAWLAAKGLGAQKFTGFLNNTDLYNLLREFF